MIKDDQNPEQRGSDVLVFGSRRNAA